jgi:hypothetical protein
MGKKIIFLMIVFLLMAVPALAAEPLVVNLKEADIKIDSLQDKKYELSETITLTNIENVPDQTITHTLSNIGESTPKDLKIVANGQELKYEMENGTNLNKLHVQVPENSSQDFTYEIQYKLTLQENSFTTPLFVPMHPTLGTANIVHIEFNAPNGETIEKNSFPVLIKSAEGKAENHIMNIPSHVKYVYGEQTNPFNIFNIVSWGVLLGLIAIIVSWFMGEMRKNKGVAA